MALRFIYFTTSEPQNIEPQNVEEWNRVAQSFLNRQNTLSDVGRSVFDVQCSLVFFFERLQDFLRRDGNFMKPYSNRVIDGIGDGR